MSDASETFQVQKKRVLEAAGKCEDAKEILSTLFPEAFDESMVNLRSLGIDDAMVCTGSKEMIRGVAGLSPHEKRSFVLSGGYNWSIEEHHGYIYLIPTNK